MTPYFIVFVFLSFFSIVDSLNGFGRLRVVFFLYSAIVLIFFSGFRALGVGDDDFNYFSKFLDFPNVIEWLGGQESYSYNKVLMEPGYVFLGAVVKVFTLDYIYLFLVVSFFSVGLSSYNYYKYSRYIFLTLTLFFVHTYLYRDMNQIRSAVAAAIGLFTISQIHNRQHIRVYFTLGLAALFHMASVVLVVAYFLSFLNITRKRVIAAYFFALSLGLIGFSQVVYSFLPRVGILEKKIQSYTESEKFTDSISMFDLTNIKNSAILFVLVFFWNRLVRVVAHFQVMVLFYLLAVGIRIAFWDLGVLAARTSTFFAIVEVILVPYFVLIFRSKLFVTILILLYSLCVLYLNVYVKKISGSYSLSIF